MSILLRRYVMKSILVIAGSLFLSLNGIHAADVRIPVQETSKIDSLDPMSNIWKNAGSAEIPLMPQAIAPPGGGGATQTVQVKALRTKDEIAFRLEWADPTKNEY